MYKLFKSYLRGMTISLQLLLLLSVNIPFVAAGPSVKYDITRFGAVGDSKTLNTLNIQAAIDACSKNV